MTFGKIMILRAAFLIVLAWHVAPGLAMIPPGTADATTAEGWRAVGFPIDDYVPWNLQLDAEGIVALDGKYLVVAGYLVASENSITLFPSEATSRSGVLDGALVLTSEDSPALRWLLVDGPFEGHFAVGGVFSRASDGRALGHLARVRFAMNKKPNQTPEPTPTSVTPRADARVAPAAVVAHL